MMYGALASRFPNHIYCPRPGRAILQKILEQMGFDPERVWLRWISASEGRLFADTMTELVATIRAKGPNPLRGQWGI